MSKYDNNHRPSSAAIWLKALMAQPKVGRKIALRVLDGIPGLHGKDLDRGSGHAAEILELFKTFDSESQALEAWGKAEASIHEITTQNIDVIAYHDSHYPARLRRIPDPPAILYAKGALPKTDGPHVVAVVGTRSPTSVGLEMARRIAATCADEGFVVVSGLAIGCDTQGHLGCLDAGGCTVAVLAHGLDRTYPAKNRDLAERILREGGALLSEYPPGPPPGRSAFIERDRLQSGLSDGVVVVETDIQGGTMHTVRFAETQHRPVACVKHPERLRAESKTRGNQELISSGRAASVGSKEELQDFLRRLHSDGPSRPYENTTFPDAHDGPVQLQLSGLERGG